MITNFDRVVQFHIQYDCLIETKPKFPDNALMELRIGLIEEELEELRQAIKDKDIVEVADALTDLLYVTYGMGVSFGIDLDKCFVEVHDSNMSKLDADGKVIRREDGKVLKGPNFREPDLKKVLRI